MAIYFLVHLWCTRYDTIGALLGGGLRWDFIRIDLDDGPCFATACSQDVKGFTTMSQQLHPSRIMRFLNTVSATITKQESGLCGLSDWVGRPSAQWMVPIT